MLRARARAGPRRVRGPVRPAADAGPEGGARAGGVDIAAIVVAFVERLAARDELDLEACGEFLVLISALLELKARAPLPGRGGRARRARARGGGRGARAPARRVPAHEGGRGLARRAARRRGRPLLPARPGAPRAAIGAAARAAGADAARRGAALARRAAAAGLARAHGAALPARRRSSSSASAPCCAGAAASTSTQRSRGSRASSRRSPSWPCSSCASRARSRSPRPPRSPRSASRGPGRKPPSRKKDHRVDRPLRLISANPLDQLARTLEALLVVASQPLPVEELAARGRRRRRADRDRAGPALASATARAAAGSCWRRSPAATPSGPPARRRRPARASFERPLERGLSQAALETLAIVAYLGPVSRPEIARIRGVAADSTVASLLERGLIGEAGRESGPGGAVRYRTTPLFERVFGLESAAALPRLDDLGAGEAEIRDRLVSIAERRAG